MSTNTMSPFALGRITGETIQTKSLKTISFQPFRNVDPFMKEIDKFGKLEGNFNNLPYPKSRDKIAAYFTNHGSHVIAQNFVEHLRQRESPRLKNVKNRERKPRKFWS